MLTQIRVAGNSEIKIEGVRTAVPQTALARKDIVVTNVPGCASDVPNQPWSSALGLLGSSNRATRAAERGHFAVGIENYIDVDGDKKDYAIVTVIGPSGAKTVRRSEGVPVPPELIEESRASKWDETCGKIEARRTPGLDHANPHPKWSNGKMDRLGQLVPTIVSALNDALRAEALAASGHSQPIFKTPAMPAKTEFANWIRQLRQKEKLTESDLQQLCDNLGFVEILVKLVSMDDLNRFSEFDGPCWIGGEINWSPSKGD